MKITKKIFNFAKASVKHAADGFTKVSEETYDKRTSICQSCPLLKEGECGLCGCPIERKALWASEACPDGKWKAQIKKPASGFSANSGFNVDSTEKPKKKKCSSCKNRH